MRENRHCFLVVADEPPICRVVALTSLFKGASPWDSFPEGFRKEGEYERFKGAREGDARQSAGSTRKAGAGWACSIQSF